MVLPRRRIGEFQVVALDERVRYPGSRQLSLDLAAGAALANACPAADEQDLTADHAGED
jgi:hypothetical protein